MAILLGLASALAYGSSDFAAGIAGRRFAAGPVTGVTQAIGVLTALVAVILFPGTGARLTPLEWGGLSGVGSGVGTLSLYRGLSIARMSVVATLSAVLTAVIPVVVGIGLGNRLGIGAGIGILLAIPAIAMVSWQPRARDRRAA